MSESSHPTLPNRPVALSHSWSVVITTRNRSAMLRQAIESCLRQTAPCEVIVVDEASSDDTPQVVRSYPGVTYLRNEVPIGHPAAANLGIQEASGQWIKPLDDDDWLEDHCIELMDRYVAAAEAAGLRPVAVTGVAINVDQNGRRIGQTRSVGPTPVAFRPGDLLEFMLDDRASMGTPLQVGHSREVAIAIGGWTPKKDHSYQFGEELGFWIKLATQGEVVYLPQSVGFRTIWPGGASARTAPEIRFRDNLRIKVLIAAQLGRSITSSNTSYLALHWAMVAVRQRKLMQAAKLLLIWIRRPDSILKLYLRTRKPHDRAIRIVDSPTA